MEKLSRAAGFSGASQCDQVTEAHLESISTLQFYLQGLKSLKPGDFEGLDALTILYLENNQLTDLPAGLFNGLSSLEFLSLTRNQLSALPSSLFAELSQLKQLQLDTNQLKNLPEGLFAGLSNLEELRLDYNTLTRVPEGLFSDLSDLEQLNLFGNQIAELPADMFVGLFKLQQLNLGFNPFTSLPDGIFTDLSSLELLSSRNTSVIELPASVFAGLSSLRDLDLTQNPLTELPDGVFADTPMLERLSLLDNSLTELPTGVFAHLSRLRDLNLYSNDLSDLPADIFAGLSSLERLVLGGNQLAGLQAGVFAHLSRLRDLNLYSSNLSDLPADIFAGLSSLERLVLSRNQLAGLPPGIFSGLGSLKELRLERNTVDPFPVLLSLKKVGNSQFKAIAPVGAPFNLVLEVNANEGGALEDAATSVTIPAGALESEPIGVLRKEGTDGAVNVDISVLPSLPSDHSGYFLKKDEDLPRWILASDNPSDASLIDLSLNGGELEPDFSPENSKYTVSVANALSKTTITPTTSNPGASVTFLGVSELTLEDADPDVEGQQVNLIVGDNTIEIAVTAVDGATTGRYTLTVTREENNCDRTAQAVDAIVEAIPDVDECGYVTTAHLSGITELDLSGRGIASLQPGDFGGLTGLESLWLYDNQLSDLPDNIFSGLPALHTLLLSNNQLEDLPVDIFSELSSLRLLSLNSNQLRLLPLGIFSGLTRLESLWLSGNQLTSLPVDLFSGLSRLQVLLLGDNNLQSLPADLFKGLDTLGTLWIQQNELGSLPENLFSGLSVLELLGLGGNQLSSLPVGVFSDLAELQILHLNSNGLTIVPENLFSGLSALEFLGLQGNQLSSLPAGVFSGLAKLQSLYLSNNRLTSVPDGLFSGLRSLRTLNLTQQDGDLPLSLSLEKVEEGRFRAKVPSGAPFLLEIPINVSNGGQFQGEAESVTVYTGESESAPATITRLADTTQAVTVDIGTIPGLPDTHSGYEFRKDEALPLEILAELRTDDASLKHLSISVGTLDPSFLPDSTGYSTLVANAVTSITITATLNNPGAMVEFLDAADRALADANASTDGHQANLNVGENTIKVKVTSNDATETRTYVIVITRDSAAGVCFRTALVRDAIVEEVSGVSSCALVTDAHLSRITALDLSNKGISSLKSGDFSGLAALTTLRLDDNQLMSLPQGVFSGLTSLQTFSLSGNLVDPLPLFVSLTNVEDSQFKAVSATGAPFALELPVSVNSAGTIEGGATSLTIPAGALESAALRVTRVAGTVEAVQVDVGALPSLPHNHDGYVLEKDAGLPLEIPMPEVAVPPEQVTGVEVTASVEEIGVSWVENLEADGYKVQWKSGEEEYDEERQSVVSGGDVVNYTITGLTAGTEYSIRVIATRENADDGPPSEEVTGTPLAMPASQVQQVEVTAGIEQLEVSWSALPEADGYKVQWKSGAEDYADSRQAVLADGDNVSYTITGLDAGTRFTVRVIATRQNAEDGTPSSEVVGVPKASPAAQVTDVEITVGVERLDVSWTAASDADGYKVQWKSGVEDYGEERQSVVSGGDVVNYTITGLTAGTEYSIRVIATRENADDSPPSEEVTGTPLAMPASQVQQVEVTAGIEQLEVSWSALPEADGYKVQWKSGAEDYADSRQAVLADGENVSYTITGLDAGTQFTVRVIATRQNAEDGAPSSEVVGVPKASPAAQVTDVEISVGVERLDVSWTAASNADGYKVQWKSGAEEYDGSREAVLVDSDTVSYTITGLTGGTEYSVRVIATRTNADDGAPSSEVTGVPLSAPPAQVTGLKITVGMEQLDVSWVAVSDADGYKVQWKSGVEDYGDSRQAVLTGGETNSYTITGLTGGTEYSVRVIATKELADDGAPSEEVTGIPKAQPPAQVTSVAVEPGFEELEVSWDVVSGADGYKVQWKSGTGDYDEARQVALPGGDTTRYTIMDLTADTQYTIRVIATREHADDGVPSEEVTATPVSPDPDVNSDGMLDGNDALIMYHTYASANQLGDGETGGTAESRESLLAGYSGKDDPTDDELKAMIRKANAWKEAGVDAGGDINEDGAIDGDDAVVMYYAYATESLVGDGETGGSERFRRLLLAAYASQENPTDEDLKAMLRRANKLREEFG